MENRSNFYQCLAGIGTGLVVTVVSSLALWDKPLFLESLVWQSAILFFLFVLGNSWLENFQRAMGRAALWLMLIAIFLLSWRVPIDIYFIYTIIWVAYSPYYLTRNQCWWWLLAISVAWYVVRVFFWADTQPLVETLLVATFHVFALLSAMAVKESVEANEKTQKLNRELLATQHLLGEASRDSERTRIARDMHDLLGHHLTALTINLQVAGHLSKGEAKEKIDQCHVLSKLLLNDVRDAVATLRSMPMVDLRELIEIAVRDIPRLQIELEVEDKLQVDDVNVAEVLLRLVQEAITNTLKHTQARTAMVQVFNQNDQLVCIYTDTGGGSTHLNPGNGLQGMRERVERLGGILHIEVMPTFNIRASIPYNNAT